MAKIIAENILIEKEKEELEKFIKFWKDGVDIYSNPADEFLLQSKKIRERFHDLSFIMLEIEMREIIKTNGGGANKMKWKGKSIQT